MRVYDSVLPSGNAYKVHLLLSHLGQQYETVDLDILSDPPQTREPQFLAINPNGRIPTLVLDDGEVLAESNAILYYLADGSDYLPEDRLARAQALRWMFFEQYSHEPYVAVLKFWTYWGGLSTRTAEQVQTWKTRGQAALDVMEQHLTAHEFFAGGQYSIADIALFAYTHSAAPLGFELGAATVAWLGRVRAQPGHVPIKADTTGAASS
ncbi:MAG: glutathione S-transferase family protein [Deltaproteobacteria bacterium]|nr:glutathione S-transferase family protein [Deltaproteobacteria bacterium]